MIDVIMSWNSQQRRIIDANILFMWIIQTDGGSWDRCSVDVLFFVLDRLFLRRDWGRTVWLWPCWRKRASKWSLLALVSPSLEVLLPILCMSFFLYLNKTVTCLLTFCAYKLISPCIKTISVLLHWRSLCEVKTLFLLSRETHNPYPRFPWYLTGLSV